MAINHGFGLGYYGGGLGAINHGYGLGAINHGFGLGAINHGFGLGDGLTSNPLVIGGAILAVAGAIGYVVAKKTKKHGVSGLLGRARRRRRKHRGLGRARARRRRSRR